MSLEHFIQSIHETPTKTVLAVAGGGSRAIAELLETPGASRTVLEAIVPYCEQAMIEWLGGRPDQFCSEPTARAMAMAAFRRACRLEPGQDRAGVACTASLATDRPKRGPHRAHVAFQTATTTVSWSLDLQKGHRPRADEERLVSHLVLNAVAAACGLVDRLTLELLPEERIEEARIIAPEPWQELLAGEIEAVREHGRGIAVPGTAEPLATTGKQSVLAMPAPASQAPKAILPGAFHPIHTGHRRMAEIAGRRLGAAVEFEIAILNVDKPPLDFLEVFQRLAQFGPEETVWLTRSATFVEKSAQFPGVVFVVGADTLRRIVDPRYYGNDPTACQSALETIAARGCRFLVFGREDSGRFAGLAELTLPAALQAICEEVSAEEFREDISSTEIRKGRDLEHSD